MTDATERLRRFLIRSLSRTHGAVHRASGGRLLGRMAGMPVLLLTTRGRKSGQPRTVPLTYFHDGVDLVVIASFGGSDLPPAWWLNLQRDPRAVVLIAGTASTVTARAATVEERDRLWPLVTTTYPGYARYQERTARAIPVVMLTPDPGVRAVAPPAGGVPRSPPGHARPRARRSVRASSRGCSWGRRALAPARGGGSERRNDGTRTRDLGRDSG